MGKKRARRKAAAGKSTAKKKRKGGPGGSHPLVSDEEITAALTQTRGMVAAAARRLGITSRCIYYRMEANPELRIARDEARELNKDLAESALLRAIEKGEAWAVCFFLKCQARDRGYIERVDVNQEANVNHTGTIDIRAVVAELTATPEFVDFARRRVQGGDTRLLRGRGEPSADEAG